MPEKKRNMDESISERLKALFTPLILVGVLVIASPFILSLFQSPNAGATTAKYIGAFSVGIAVIVIVVGMIISMTRDFDLHNKIDKTIFKTRKKVGGVISSKIIEEAEIHASEIAKTIDPHDPQVMKLFYHFVNRQEELRGLAFTYWEDYFVNITKLVSIAIITLFTVAYGLINDMNVIIEIAMIAELLLFLVYFIANSGLRKKILELPIIQIDEFLSSHTEEFIDQLRVRFAGEKPVAN